MSARAEFRFPAEQEAQRAKARKLAWLSIGMLLTVIVTKGAVMGQSEAMRTTWVSDLLALIPPITELIAYRYETRAPSERFPYGYFRSVSVAFLATASVLTVVGLSLLYDAVSKLLAKERPPIGSMSVAGHQLWAGWAMIAVLVYAMGVGLLLGLLKRPVATKLNDRVLSADADMNRADYLSEIAAIVGITLVGFGFWWGDSVAAGIISLEILHDGWDNVKQVIADLMDEAPTKLGGTDLEPLPQRLREIVERVDWVERASVRLREQGHVLTGEVFVVPRDERDLVARLADVSRTLEDVDWRLRGIVVVPVAGLETGHPPSGEMAT